MSESTPKVQGASNYSCLYIILILASVAMIILKYTGVAAGIPLWVALLPGGLVIVFTIFALLAMVVGFAIIASRK